MPNFGKSKYERPKMRNSFFKIQAMTCRLLQCANKRNNAFFSKNDDFKWWLKFNS